MNGAKKLRVLVVLLITALAVTGVGLLYTVATPRSCDCEEFVRLATRFNRSQPQQASAAAAKVAAVAPALASAVTETSAVSRVNAVVDNERVVAVPVNFHGFNLTVLAFKNDEHVGAEVIRSHQPFQAYILKQLMDFITPGSTVVDAGGNMGLFTVFFAAKAGRYGAVYSFEPQARMYQLLCANVIVNGLMNVYTQNKALSEKPGVLHMSSTVPDGVGAHKSYSELDATGAVMNYGGMRLGASGEEVQAVTLDSFNLTNVALIKVDIQGAEKLMMYGARDTIRRNMPVIAYEELVGTAGSDSSLNERDIEKELPVSEDVKSFNIKQFLLSLGYRVPPDMINWEDKIYVPPNHPFWTSASPPSPPFVHPVEADIKNTLKRGVNGDQPPWRRRGAL